MMCDSGEQARPSPSVTSLHITESTGGGGGGGSGVGGGGVGGGECGGATWQIGHIC